MGSIGPMEIVLLAVLAALIFGPAKLPHIGRSIGRGVRDFKDSVDGTGVGEMFEGINDVRSAVSPSNVARAFVPGLAETQDSVRGAGGVESHNDAAVPAAGADPAAGSAPPEAPGA